MEYNTITLFSNFLHLNFSLFQPYVKQEVEVCVVKRDKFCLKFYTHVARGENESLNFDHEPVSAQFYGSR